MLKKTDKRNKLFDNLNKIETLKFLIEKNIPKNIDMLYNGVNKLTRFLQRHCLYYNYLYYNWINFAKAFFDYQLNQIYIDEYRC